MRYDDVGKKQAQKYGKVVSKKKNPSDTVIKRINGKKRRRVNVKGKDRNHFHKEFSV